jgi:hypothetical protein
MSPSLVSFLVFFNGKGVTWNGEENIGLAHFAKIENYNNSFN